MECRKGPMFLRASRILSLALVPAVWLSAADVANNATIFRERLSPVLAKHCAACHTGAAAQSGFAVDSFEALLKGGKRGPGLEPGSAKTSLVLRAIRGEGAPKMPLGSALPEEAVAEISAAIDSMAALPKSARKDMHWEWLKEKPGAVTPPTVGDATWVRNPIDAFVLARLEKEGMKPAAPATPRALIRRVYFDLIGLPPSPEEVQAFEKDPSPEAYAKVIDRLLENPRYGERWGRHWLDLVRFAESDGFAVDGERPTAWRYRDYVIRSFNHDKPYDVFVQEQIAGDEFRGKGGGSASERAVALGFLRMGPWEVDANSKKQLRQDYLNEITATVSNVFLGLTSGCAQCHDHKYDPIPQRDYYRLQAFFAATATAEVPAPHDEVENPQEMRRRLRQHEDEADVAAGDTDRMREELKARFIKEKKLKEDDPEVKKFVGLLGTKNLFFLEQDLPLVKEPGWREAFQAYFDARDRRQQHQEYIRRYQPVAYGVRDLAPPAVPETPATYILASGELEGRGAVVEPGFLECISGKADPATIPFAGGSTGRRLALAEWIASPDNPLTSRVVVNRVWLHHFGDGIVRTPSDFGNNGDPPSHPELLDWLAHELVARKWSLKAMHRLMLTSNTYMQASTNPEREAYTVKDPDNRLLWRMNWQRLDAESLRDSILYLTERLTPNPGGPGVFFPVADDVAQGFEFFKWFPSSDKEQRSPTVYMFQRRSVLLPMAETFDSPNLSASCSRRSSTIVAPQALTLLNGSLTRTEAKHFAARIEREAPDAEGRISRAFWLTLGREPSTAERDRCRKLVERGAEGDASLAAVLFNLNEFLYLE